MQHEEELIPLRAFCEEVGIHLNTVTMYWRPAGQAPDLVRKGNRLFITNRAWDAWLRRREADRQRTGKPHLRAPLPTLG